MCHNSIVINSRTRNIAAKKKIINVLIRQREEFETSYCFVSENQKKKTDSQFSHYFPKTEPSQREDFPSKRFQQNKQLSKERKSTVSLTFS